MNKIDCSIVLKNGKIEGVHDLHEQQQALYLLAFREHEASGNDDVISRMHFA